MIASSCFASANQVQASLFQVYEIMERCFWNISYRRHVVATYWIEGVDYSSCKEFDAVSEESLKTERRTFFLSTRCGSFQLQCTAYCAVYLCAYVYSLACFRR